MLDDEKSAGGNASITANANNRVRVGYGLNYLIDTEKAIIVDVEAMPARTYDEVVAARIIIDRTEVRIGLKPGRAEWAPSAPHFSDS
jgi:hypothetical protein